MTNHRRRTSTIIVLFALMGSWIVSGSAGANATEGEWTEAFAEDAGVAASAPQDEATSAEFPTAVSAIVLPDGNVAFWNGLQDTENLNAPLALSIPPDQFSKTRHLNLRTYFASGELPDADDFSIPENEAGDGADLFCSDQRLLADGRVLVVGGSVWVNEDETTTDGTPLEGLGRSELYGAKDARIYDPGTPGSWDNAAAPDMAHGRWYPAMVTLADGDLLVAGGVGRLIYNSQLAPGQAPPEFPLPQNVRESETYDPDTDTWTQNEDAVSLPLYARLHLMPDGDVLYDTTGQAWGPFGEDQDQLTWGMPKLYDPSDSSWTDVLPGGLLSFLGHRSGSFSVMLPLEADDQGNYSEAKILIGGGVLLPSPGSWLANNITEIMTWNADGTISRDPAAPLNNPRWFSSGVGLPTGEVLALNGADLDEVIFPGMEGAVRQAELYDPESDTWTPLASGNRDRTYHNSAVLLKDGSVLIGGHSPITAGYGQDHGTYRANGFKDASFEIFKPPYLFRGDRPVINGVSSATPSRGDTITVTTPNHGSENLRVVLSRLPGVTHVTDADQRTVNVDHVDNADGTISFDVPTVGGVVPDGYYYLFLVDDTGAGETPSVAQIITVAG